MPRWVRGDGRSAAGMLPHDTFDIQVIAFLSKEVTYRCTQEVGGIRPVMRQKPSYLCLGIDTLSALVTPGNNRGSQGTIW
jgi:hypothetical protein